MDRVADQAQAAEDQEAQADLAAEEEAEEAVKLNGYVPPTTVAVSTDNCPWSTFECDDVIGFSVRVGLTFTVVSLVAFSEGVPRDESVTVTLTFHVPRDAPPTVHVCDVPHPDFTVR